MAHSSLQPIDGSHISSLSLNPGAQEAAGYSDSDSSCASVLWFWLFVPKTTEEILPTAFFPFEETLPTCTRAHTHTHTHTDTLRYIHKQLINAKLELEQNGELSILLAPKNQFNVKLCFSAKTNQNKQQRDISRELESQINQPYQFQTEGTSESSFCQTRPCFCTFN